MAIIRNYDNVHCGTLMDRLKAVGFLGNLLAFIFNLVTAWELTFKSRAL
jgi:hypothetical protein